MTNFFDSRLAGLLLDMLRSIVYPIAAIAIGAVIGSAFGKLFQ